MSKDSSYVKLNDVESYVLKLEALSIPKSTIQQIISLNDDFFKSECDKIIKLADEITNSSKLTNYLSKQKLAFSNINSKEKRNKFVSSLPNFVKPRQLNAGSCLETVFDKSINDYKIVQVSNTFAYVPILETLKAALGYEPARNLIVSKPKSQKNIYKDIEDGSYLSNHPLFKNNKLPIKLHFFNDDFVGNNQLKPKTKVYKMGAIYFIIRNFPPFFNCKLENIFLALLFHVTDVKDVTFDHILGPLIHDIKILEENGVEINGTEIFGSIVVWSFDNLGGNTLFGLVESFLADNCCRICTVLKK